MASINCINQSDDGYIWLGTDGAELVRFDGKSFEEVRDPNGDNNHHYENIFFYQNNILFASRYKGFFQINRKTNAIKRIDTKGVSFGEAKACLALDSIYYFIGSRGIYSKRGRKAVQLHEFEGNLDIYQVLESENALFVLTNQGKFRLSEGKLLSFKDWLKIDIENLEEFKFGVYDNGKLSLTNDEGDRWLEIILNSRGSFFSIDESDHQLSLDQNEKIISLSFNKSSNVTTALTDLGQLYLVKKNTFDRIAHNYSEPLVEASEILVDYNGDFWIISDLKGLYKVSQEAFTSLKLLPIYEFGDIIFPYRTIYGDVFISRMNGETYVRNLVDHNVNYTYDFIIHGMDEINGVYYIGTNKGLKRYDPSSDEMMSDAFFKNQNITMLFVDGNDLWVGVAGIGLHLINVNSGEVTLIKSDKTVIPQYFYTAEASYNGRSILFGTNNGLFRYYKNTEKIERIPTDAKLGSYSGVSTRDVYGNCWFTLEKGIVCITSKNKTTLIDGDKYLNTNLFYTLSSDNYGNLIVGTNKGVTVIKVDKNGAVKDFRRYDGDSGFEGYETHMRSQFDDESGIFVGTVEGLFLINTDILENLHSPLPPVITELTQNIATDNVSDNFTFQFHVNNAKAGKITYSYRLKGYKDDWVTLENNEVSFYDLSNGEYTLEVRSSFDGIHFSKSAYRNFKVTLPIWRTNWFIVLVLIIIVAINVALIRYNKSFNTSSLLDTKDTEVHLRMTPTLLLFSTIAVTGAHIIAPVLNDELALHLEVSLFVGFVLFTLYFMSLSAKKTGKEFIFKRLLTIGLILIVGHFYFEIYVSNLHPFHIIGVVLTASMAPYILAKIKSTIIFSLALLGASVICMLLVREPVYSKVYFFIAMLVMVALLIFTSFLRYDSIEKLMFISGIINKGNIPAIAFDKRGTIKYISENISLFIDAKHDELLNENIATLNNHIPFEGEFRDVDVLKDFEDGKKYLVPMADGAGVVRWIEWAYRDFSKNVKVMLGQDVSEKMELENTYELLVQNAEDFIYRCDVEGNFIFANEVCYSKLGYTKEDLLGNSAVDIVHMDYQQEIAEYYYNQFKNKKVSSYYEFPITQKDGTIIWVGQYVTTLFAAGSKSFITGFIALARDITENREKKKLIEEQRDNITSSINYAQRIQLNLLPHKRLFNSYFKENFILFKPKDIVSGDFYWMEKIENKTILALADCTGHGVPGSFMTLLGINLLNSIVHEDKVNDPGMILNELDKQLVEILPRGSGANRMNDGMEITLCVIDDNSNELSFACAGSRFLIRKDDEFTMLKGDNKHIGDEHVEGFGGYQTNFTELNPEDQLYLFTDGFQDQFGGPNDKKYSFRRMLELFESSAELPLQDQSTIIESEFDEWIGQGDQTDDLSVISIKRNVI